MNKSKRSLIYFVFIFVVMFIGPLLLGWTIFKCMIVLALAALVMKLTDIEDTIEGIKWNGN